MLVSVEVTIVEHYEQEFHHEIQILQILHILHLLQNFGF
jgi:hypothetical protein